MSEPPALANADPYAPPGIDDLVGWMTGQPSTSQWDVVCSYTVKQLNSFLQAQYDAGRLAKEVTITSQVEDPISEQPIDVKYDLHFSSPVLSFVGGRSGVANLVMNIQDGSSYTLTVEGKAKVHPIPGGTYAIQAVVPLAAIQGDTGKVSNAGDVIAFSEGKDEAVHVILHFKNDKGTTFQLVPQATGADNLPLNIWLKPVLEQYFQAQVKEIDYALVGLNNAKPDQGAVVLTPKAFVFASAGDSSGGAISLYIQTVRDGSVAGNPDPAFAPGAHEALPIPAGFTASLILSYDLITRGYLKPQLENNGFAVAFITTLDGIRAQLKSGASVVVDAQGGQTIIGSYTYGGLSLNLNDYPLTMWLKGGLIQLEWVGKTTSDWSEYTSLGPGKSSAHYGKVDVTITLKKAAVALGTPSQTDITLANISIATGDFSLQADGHSCSFLERLGGCLESPPPFYEHMNLKIPSINLALPHLNFFATTNLISPGDHVIDIDTGTGIKTPHDFLIVGQVTTKKALRAKQAR